MKTTILLLMTTLFSFLAIWFCIIPLIGPAVYGYMLGKVCYRFRGEFDSEPSKTKPAMILSMFIANLFFSWIFIWPVLSFDFAWKIAVVNIVLSLLLFKLAYVIDKWTDQKNQIDHVEVLK